MRRSRGNIILTALFIAIFLFFLSVALIWTNRQDIALSLSMEHKLKAQSAARSAAYEAFYRLRKFGELQGFASGSLASGANYNVELVRMEATESRGAIVEVRSRGRSGPVTSYLTLHLLETEIASEENESESRVLFFPGAASAPGAEGGESGSETEAAPEQAGSALFGDFKLTEGGPGLVAGIKANQGPAFLAEEIGGEDEDDDGEVDHLEPPAFLDSIPVYSGPTLRAWGPVQVMAPTFPTLEGARPTNIRRLVYGDDEFDWEPIDPPEELGDESPPEDVRELFRMSAPDNSVWTNGSVLAQNVWTGLDFELRVRSFAWAVKEEPPAVDVSDVVPLSVSEPEPVGVVVDWSLASHPGAQEKFQTRGAIYPVGDSVYSHAWHLLYQPHDGSFPSTPTLLDGSTLTRWPCILKYTIDDGWEEVWTPLKNDGSVTVPHRPDPTVLAATTTGIVYTVTEAKEGEQRRLLTIDGSSIRLGDPIPDGQLIVYRDRPYIVSVAPQAPPLLSLDEGDDIDFTGLPKLLPEIHGEVIDVTGTETLVLGIEGGYSGEPLDSSKRLRYTARPRYDFDYSLDPAAQIAVDGNDLWAVLIVRITQSEPTFEKGYDKGPYQPAGDGNFEERKTLARYDGTRWHILPHGLRACLSSANLRAPGAGAVAARYPGLPAQQSRYAIVSVSTNPF